MNISAIRNIGTIIGIGAGIVAILKGIAELGTNDNYLQFFRELGGWIWILLGVLVVASVVVLIIFRRPKYDFQILNTRVMLSLLDPGGEAAEVVKEVEMKFMRTGMVEHIDRFSTDGMIDEDSWKIDKGVLQQDEPEFKGTYKVVSKFPETSRKGEIFKKRISCRFLFSFSDEEEFWILEPFYPIDNYILEINFPDDRLAKTCHAFIISPLSSETIKNFQPELVNGGKKVVFEMTKPKLSQRIKIAWTW